MTARARIACRFWGYIEYRWYDTLDIAITVLDPFQHLEV